MATIKSEIEGGDPPEGMPPAELMILHDPEGERSLAIVIFDNEDDYRKGDEILDAMPAAGHAGQRTSVTKYDVAVRMNDVVRASLRPRGRRGGRSAGRRRGRSPARTARRRPRGRAGAGSRRCGSRRALRPRSGSCCASRIAARAESSGSPPSASAMRPAQ